MNYENLPVPVIENNNRNSLLDIGEMTLGQIALLFDEKGVVDFRVTQPDPKKYFFTALLIDGTHIQGGPYNNQADALGALVRRINA